LFWLFISKIQIISFSMPFKEQHSGINLTNDQLISIEQR
jgi:hypothetical protein